MFRAECIFLFKICIILVIDQKQCLQLERSFTRETIKGGNTELTENSSFKMFILTTSEETERFFKESKKYKEEFVVKF